MRFFYIVSLVVALGAAAPPRAAIQVAVAQATAPELLQRVELPDGIDALAFSADGLRVAYAQRFEFKRHIWSEIVLLEADEERRTRLPGIVRDLLFLPPRSELVGVRYRPAKRNAGESALFRWRVGEPKVETIMSVPPTTRDLDLWPGGDAVLLTSRNEIRTILLPDLQSGPLFRFLGSDLVVTSMGGGSHVLVGTGDRLLLLDLSVPSGRDSMPPVASLQLPAAVIAVAGYPSGRSALVLLADRRIYRAGFAPQELQPLGHADRIAGVAHATSFAELPRATQAVVAAEKDETEPDGGAEQTAREEPPAPQRADVPKPAAPIVEPIAVASEEAKTAAPDGSARSAQLSGQVVGIADVVVVLFGPNNILREAARVPLDGDGFWRLDGLVPGRYRIYLDSGGRQLLVTKPRFVIVEIGATPVVAAKIEVVRSF